MLSRFSNKDFRLGDLLLANGLLTPGQLSRAVLVQRETGGQLGQVLISLGYISSRQLDRTLLRQRWLRRIAWMVAFLCTPIHFASARETVAQPVQLPAWDAPLAEQVNGFTGPSVQQADDVPDQFASVSVSLTNVQLVYRTLAGETTPLNLPSSFQPQVDRLMYNVEMAAGGGLRVNLQYRF